MVHFGAVSNPKFQLKKKALPTPERAGKGATPAKASFTQTSLVGGNLLSGLWLLKSHFC